VTSRGKSLFLGERKLTVCGVTYGPFQSGARPAWDPDVVAADFAQMAAHGINAIRVYTAPPRWLLDLAAEHSLLVMVGIPWEQHITFLDSGRAAAIEQTVRDAVAECAGHPAVLCYAIGNEIPASIVRWHGRRRVERFLGRLCRAARAVDPGTLVTYVNFPPTEYLRVPDADIVAFNVYLEERERFEAYLARLQNLADDRPLIIAELGLDSARNGLERQASTLAWQLEATAAAACAGTFVFAWTDEWHRGGHEILDWDFGLVTRSRDPKPALGAVAATFAAAPPQPEPAPRISIVICTYNGAATLRECLEGVRALDYPDFETIVVSDGSTDASPQIAAEYDVRLIETENRGLASARNTGAQAATGEIVAYLDDDAVPDRDWLTYLARAFADPAWGAVGGPNILPPGSCATSECVANAPGGPTHVLVDDREAEHVPGCNLAVRRAALEQIGGFDPQFRAAGDDVDFCWRLLDAGHRIGFSPGAVVWHHRRRTVRAYLRQQRGYGKAEALLERKWPAKYSPVGHVGWGGRLYGNGSAQHRGGWRWRIYYGGWGTAFFQSVYGPRGTLLESLPLMPEWYLAMLALAAVGALGLWWPPLLLALPLLALAGAALVADAALGALRARFPGSSGGRRLRLRTLTATLYLLQPLARLGGRLGEGLTPWRRRGPSVFRLPAARTLSFWSERWQSTEERVRGIAEALRGAGSIVVSGGDWDRWDLQVRGGVIGAARLRVGIEEHGSGCQVVRVRVWPHVPGAGILLGALVASLAAGSVLTDAWTAAMGLGSLALAVVVRLIYECGAAAASVHRTLREPAPAPGGARVLLGSQLPQAG
jgi:GT2 family glycosyltransferase